MRGGFSVATVKSAVCGGFAVSLAALAGFSGFSAVAAPPAKAETCEAASTEQLVSCVAKVNANPGANKIVMAAGIYLPEATLRLKNTTGPTTLEGPAVGSRVAKLEGGSVVPFPSELMVISPRVSVILKNLEEGTGGGGGLLSGSITFLARPARTASNALRALAPWDPAARAWQGLDW